MSGTLQRPHIRSNYTAHFLHYGHLSPDAEGEHAGQGAQESHGCNYQPQQILSFRQQGRMLYGVLRAVATKKYYTRLQYIRSYECTGMSNCIYSHKSWYVFIRVMRRYPGIHRVMAF